MKTPPETPEFAKFTQAMKGTLSVSKDELQRRIKAEKKGKRFKASASPGSAAVSNAAH